MSEIKDIERRKMNLVLNCLHAQYEDAVLEKLKTTNFESMDEMDEWVDRTFREHWVACEHIKSYYKSKFNFEE